MGLQRYNNFLLLQIFLQKFLKNIVPLCQQQEKTVYMDIDLLSKMVKELILDHDRVSLPGLGTFVAETVPATFSDKGYTINPPYRKLSFRPQSGDDTLITELYADANGIDRGLAEKAVIDFTKGLREVLETRRNVVFPGLGRLRATRENNFFFVADESLDIYPEGFGLDPVSLKTHEETKEEVSAAIGALKDMIEDHESSDAPAGLEIIPEVLPADINEPEEESEDLKGAEPKGDGQEEEPVEDLGPQQSQENEVTVEQEIEETDDAGPGDEEPGKVVSEEAEIKRKRLRKAGYIAMIVILSVILLMLLYAVVARIFPDFIDRILYNEEQFRILHYNS